MAENVEGMTQLLKRLAAVGKTPQDLIDDWPVRTTRNAKERFEPHKKTGTTSRSIQPGAKTKHSAEVRADGNAAFIEYGTRPHVIRPRSAKVLAWPAAGVRTTLTGRAARSGPAYNSKTKSFRAGTFIFARQVNHPGTKADPFMLPAAQDALDEFLHDDPVHRRWNKAR